MIRIAPYDDDRHRADVIALWTAAFGYTTAHNAPGLSIDRKLALADGLLFVALDDGEGGARVAGTVMAGYDGHRGWLYSVAVDPQCRGAGIGGALVSHAERALAALGCVKINLQIVGGNEAVASFYEALGYAIEPRISMGKRIAANIPESG